MPNQNELKEIFNLYDEELDGKIDGTQVGDVVRAAGLKPTNAAVWKAAGQEYKRKGEKRLTFEEWLPIYEQLSKEKVSIAALAIMPSQYRDLALCIKSRGAADFTARRYLQDTGSFADFMEGLKVFDKEECGKIMAAELRHILLALGERLSTEEVDELLKGAEDGDGNINYESFIKKVMAGPFPEE